MPCHQCYFSQRWSSLFLFFFFFFNDPPPPEFSPLPQPAPLPFSYLGSPAKHVRLGGESIQSPCWSPGGQRRGPPSAGLGPVAPPAPPLRPLAASVAPFHPQ